jgi:hypothetical protein
MDLEQKNAIKRKIFCCNICAFNTSNKYDFERHESTRKHTKNVELNQSSISNVKNSHEYICSNCNKTYYNKSSHWYHSKKCSQKPLETRENLQNTLTPDLFMAIIKENKELQNVLIEQNRELQNKILEQNAEHHKQLVELASKQMVVNNNTNTNSNNTQNNHFNIQLFLNNTCKDAINIEQFIKDIQISISDLENVGNQGYVQGISDIIIKNMRTLGLTKRPMHCTDIKRETIYIKDADKWEKDSQEKPKLKSFINRVAKKNLAKIPEWYKDHPEVTVLDSKDYEMNHKLIRQSFGDGDIDVLQNKVVKQLVKETYVDKCSNSLV